MDFKDWMKTPSKGTILVSIPHSQSNLPKELIPLADPEQWSATRKLVERHTDTLYDFRDVLQNKQVVFPYNRFYIDVNRCPEMVNESMPVHFVRDKSKDTPLYQQDKTPSPQLRKELIVKYHDKYHASIANYEKSFIFDGHAMEADEPDEYGINNKARINIYSWQDPIGEFKTCPDALIETYADEVAKRLPKIRIAVNPRKFQNTYGHIMAYHGLNGVGPDKIQVPLIMQETDENLYLDGDKFDREMHEKLRQAFAEALKVMSRRLL